MKLAIITVRRPGEEFVHRSLESLLLAGGWRDQFHLFCGAHDPTYLAEVGDWPQAVRHLPNEHQRRELEGRDLYRRHTYNYWRVLDHFARAGDDIILAEDDVLYDKSFADKVRQAVREMDRIASDYVLSLYCDRDLAADDNLRLGRFITAYPASGFYGTQAVYLPASSVALYARLLRERGVDEVGDATDILINTIGVERQNIYAVASSLVQHIGHHTTGLASFFHESPTFARPWPWITHRELPTA